MAAMPVSSPFHYEDSSLIEHSLFGTEDIVEKAVRELQAAAKGNTFCLRFSGGKDNEKRYKMKSHLQKD